MKTSSAKKKGRRCSANVAKMLWEESRGGTLQDDYEIVSSGVTGRDVKLSPAAQRFWFKAAIECKNVEKLNVRDAYRQACTHARPGEIPVLFHMRNRDVLLVTVLAEDFLRLLRERSHTGSNGQEENGSGPDEDHVSRLPGTSSQEGA